MNDGGSTAESATKRGWLYVIHFDKPLKHARHYLGSTHNPFQRLEAHATGNGARLTEVLKELGEAWKLAALYEVNDNIPVTLREIEAVVKTQANGPRFCPICNPRWTAPRWTRPVPIPPQLEKEIEQWHRKSLATSPAKTLTDHTSETESHSASEPKPEP